MCILIVNVLKIATIHLRNYRTTKIEKCSSEDVYLLKNWVRKKAKTNNFSNRTTEQHKLDSCKWWSHNKFSLAYFPIENSSLINITIATRSHWFNIQWTWSIFSQKQMPPRLCILNTKPKFFLFLFLLFPISVLHKTTNNFIYQ